MVQAAVRFCRTEQNLKHIINKQIHELMKRLILTAAFIAAFGATLSAQTATQATTSKGANITITRDGKTFTAHKETNKGSGYTETSYTYIDTDGKSYKIYTHTTQKGKNAGTERCYIQRVSKESGKAYWKAIPVKPDELR